MKKKDICPGPVSDPVTAEPGVLRDAVDSDARTLTIDYDLSRISDKAVQGIASGWSRRPAGASTNA